MSAILFRAKHAKDLTCHINLLVQEVAGQLDEI